MHFQRRAYIKEKILITRSSRIDVPIYIKLQSMWRKRSIQCSLSTVYYIPTTVTYKISLLLNGLQTMSISTAIKAQVLEVNTSTVIVQFEKSKESEGWLQQLKYNIPYPGPTLKYLPRFRTNNVSAPFVPRRNYV